MIRLSRMLLALCAVWILPLAAAGQGLIYECDMPENPRQGGWIAPKIAVVVPGDGRVVVSDGVILHFLKKPLEGEILRENDKVLALKWVIKNARVSGASFVNFTYRATIVKNNGSIRVRALPAGYDRGPEGTGTCRTRVR